MILEEIPFSFMCNVHSFTSDSFALSMGQETKVICFQLLQQPLAPLSGVVANIFSFFRDISSHFPARVLSVAIVASKNFFP